MDRIASHRKRPYWTSLPDRSVRFDRRLHRVASRRLVFGFGTREENSSDYIESSRVFVRRAAQRTFRLSATRSSLISAVEATGRALIAFVLRLAPAAPLRSAQRPVRSANRCSRPAGLSGSRWGESSRLEYRFIDRHSSRRYRMLSQRSESK